MMKKKPLIIELVGQKSVGKTSTLKSLIRLLLNNDKDKYIWSSVTFENVVKKTCKSDSKWFTKSNNISDLLIVLEYQGNKIGICTYGDSVSMVLRGWNSISKHVGDIDIFIYAKHERMNPAKYITHSECKTVLKRECNDKDEKRCIKEIKGLIDALE